MCSDLGFHLPQFEVPCCPLDDIALSETERSYCFKLSV